MLKLPISEIVEQVCKATNREDKINILRRHDSQALRTYLKLAIDKNMRMLIPEGTPNFRPCEQLDVEWVLYNELRRMYIFYPGGNPNLSQGRREALFITLLESMGQKDAEFLCNVVKDKKLPQGISAKLIKEAYPGL